MFRNLLKGLQNLFNRFMNLFSRQPAPTPLPSTFTATGTTEERQGLATSSQPVPTPVPNRFTAIPKTRDRLGLTPAIYNIFHNDINLAITKFNASSTATARIDALREMQAVIQRVDIHSLAEDGPGNLSQAVQFHEFKKELFTKIKSAYAESGVLSMAKTGSSTVAQVLADMPLEKADQLMEILHKGRSLNLRRLQEELSALYLPEDPSLEAEQWRQFLRAHTLEFLGGGNSKNFKVTTIANGAVKVLKIDNRLGMPRHIEQHLREALGDVFTPIEASRQVRGVDPSGALVSRTLLVTDLCTSGSVDEHSDTLRKKTPYEEREIFLGASNIMGQMARSFREIQNAGCIFPDSKLTNWLVDSTGTIRLADTKSFLFTEQGVHKHSISGNEGTGIISSKGFQPSEMFSGSVNAEKLHASILGRNIYVYLTGNWPNHQVLQQLNEPIFNSEIGSKYKRLIQNLIKDPPLRRMSLDKAEMKLLKLEMRVDGDYRNLSSKAKKVGNEAGFELKGFVLSILKTALGRPGFSKRTSIAQIDDLLDKLKTASDQCNLLMMEISNSKFHGKSLVDIQELVAQKNAMMHGANSIDDLTRKLEGFENLLQEKKLKLNQDLEKLVMLSRQCDEVINEINDIKFQGSSLVSAHVLARQKSVLIEGSSINDLMEKLEKFESKLKVKKIELHQEVARREKMAEYQQLRGQIEQLKSGDDDREMSIYLTKCDNTLLNGENPLASITAQIAKMQQVKAGLEKPENIEINRIKDKCFNDAGLLTRKMRAKGNLIEKSMASIPIEERARLLQSTHAGVTKLFSALAWNRKSPFIEPARDHKVQVASSAKEFKKFRDMFREQMAERLDVAETEQSRVTTGVH